MEKLGLRKITGITARDDRHFVMTVDFPRNQEITPGTFFMIRGWDDFPVLNRPFSVFDYEGGNLSFFIRKKGKGTEILSKLSPGDKIQLQGPLGNGFTDCEGWLAVGAGMGIAPIHYAARKYGLDTVYGCDSMRDMFGFDTKGYIVCTLDGSCGEKGNALELVIKAWSGGKYKGIIACGPEPFLSALQKKGLSMKINLQISWEERMGCGTGLCMSCSRKIEGRMVSICREGPVLKYMYGQETSL